jgi:hypothetical protein
MGGLVLLGGACMLIGWITVLWKAFSAGMLWGLACFFVPFVSLFFVATHWHEAKTGFLLHLVGWIIFIYASVTAPDVPAESMLRALGVYTA